MAEVLVEFPDVVLVSRGRRFVPRACGAEFPGGRWEGWIEFEDLDSAEVLRGPRETTQPGRPETVYWATGLTAVYLDGALERALHEPVKSPSSGSRPEPPLPRGGGDDQANPPAHAVLDPFSVYRKGEPLLRRQLSALSAWHLVNIVRAHRLSAAPAATLNGMSAEALIELIVESVSTAREKTGTAAQG